MIHRAMPLFHFRHKKLPRNQLLINDLPEEILLFIFRLLPVKVKVSILPCVCHKWLRLSRDPILFRFLQLVPVKCKAKFWRERKLQKRYDSFLQFLKKLETLKVQELQIGFVRRRQNINNVQEVVNRILPATWANLRKLSLNALHLNCRCLCQVISHMSADNMTVLELHYVWINEIVMRKICKLKKLQKLYLVECRDFLEEALEVWKEERFPHLVELTITLETMWTLNDTSIAIINDQLPDLLNQYYTQLQYVAFSQELLTPKIYAILSKCPDLLGVFIFNPTDDQIDLKSSTIEEVIIFFNFEGPQTLNFGSNTICNWQMNNLKHFMVYFFNTFFLLLQYAPPVAEMILAVSWFNLETLDLFLHDGFIKEGMTSIWNAAKNGAFPRLIVFKLNIVVKEDELCVFLDEITSPLILFLSDRVQLEKKITVSKALGKLQQRMWLPPCTYADKSRAASLERFISLEKALYRTLTPCKNLSNIIDRLISILHPDLRHCNHRHLSRSDRFGQYPRIF